MWAFGIMLYEMATAYKPTDVKNYKYGSGAIPYVPRDWRKQNKHIKTIIDGCLTMNPEERMTPE